MVVLLHRHLGHARLAARHADVVGAEALDIEAVLGEAVGRHEADDQRLNGLRHSDIMSPTQMADPCGTAVAAVSMHPGPRPCKDEPMAFGQRPPRPP